MDLSLLETLRYKIATAKVFADVFDYFFDHFGEDPEFIDASEPTTNDMLVQLLGEIGGAVFKTDRVRLDNLLLLRVAEYNFIHGGMTINGAMANVLYCEDLRLGIVVIYRPKSDPPTQFARFSAEMLTRDPDGQASEFRH